MTATTERRREVLQLAREHNLLILEGTPPYIYPCPNFRDTFTDDPYYYLYYGAAPRPPSYFALELEEPEVGRVLRFDSLSKILSSGLRIGFVSGPEPLVHAIDMHVRHLRPLTRVDWCFSHFLVDRGVEPANLLAHADHRVRAAQSMGLRRLPHAHEERLGVLSAETGRVRGGDAEAHEGAGGVGAPRGRDVLLVSRIAPSTLRNMVFEAMK